jgi:hypothetical protein
MHNFYQKKILLNLKRIVSSLKKFKCSGYKLVILFGLFKLATFFYLVSLTKTRIIPKYKQNVLIDITATANDDFVSVLFDFSDKPKSKFKDIQSQIPASKLQEQWYVYLVEEENSYNKNLIHLELSRRNHIFYYYSQPVAFTYQAILTDNQNLAYIDLARLLNSFEEKDFVVLRINVPNEKIQYDLLFHLIKENAYKQIDHIYIDHKIVNKTFPDFFSQLLASKNVIELKSN